jgi:hypothetical protein
MVLLLSLRLNPNLVCNKTFPIIHSIVSGLLIIIIDLVVIVIEGTHKNGNIEYLALSMQINNNGGRMKIFSQSTENEKLY